MSPFRDPPYSVGMSFFGIDNAVTWVQFRIRGGRKSLAFLGGGYFIVIGSLILLTVQTNPLDAQNTLHNWCNILLGLQLAGLILFGGGRVTAAIRNDVKSRVIESHRLMPLHPIQVMLGYLAGSTVHPSILFAVNFFLGFYSTIYAHLPVADWLMSNGVVLLFGAFVWCMMALSAFLGQWATATMFILLSGGFSTGGFITVLLPGMCVILGPLIGNSVFFTRVGNLATPPYAFSIVAQVLIGATLVMAASRRMARDDAPAFTPPLALLLLGAWTGASAIGILRWEEFRPVLFRFMRLEPGVQFAGTMAVTLILANLPIAAAGRLRSAWQRRVASGDAFAGRAPVHPFVALLLSILFCGLLQLVAPHVNGGYDIDRNILTGSIIAMTLVTLAMMQWSVYARRDRSAGWVVAIYLFFILLSPLLADFVRHALTDNYDDQSLGTLSIYSPLGMLIQLWTSDSKPTLILPGMFVNGVLCVLAAAVYAKVSTANRSSKLNDMPVATADGLASAAL